MKSVLLLASCLSILPIISTARVRPLTDRPVTMPITPADPAFKVPGLNIESSTCGAQCLSSAEKHREREAVTAVNRSSQTGETTAIGEVLKVVPAVSASLQNKGLSSKEVQSATTALIAAITKSEKDDWDSPTQSNVVAFVEALALDPVANQKKLAEVRENCRL